MPLNIVLVCFFVLLFLGDAEIAGLGIAGLDNDGPVWQGVDIAGLSISGRVCDSELGNMYSAFDPQSLLRSRLDRRP